MATLISMYDPIVNAYRQVPIEQAKKFVEEAKEMEKKIKKIEEGK